MIMTIITTIIRERKKMMKTKKRGRRRSSDGGGGWWCRARMYGIDDFVWCLFQDNRTHTSKEILSSVLFHLIFSSRLIALMSWHSRLLLLFVILFWFDASKLYITLKAPSYHRHRARALVTVSDNTRIHIKLWLLIVRLLPIVAFQAVVVII